MLDFCACHWELLFVTVPIQVTELLFRTAQIFGCDSLNPCVSMITPAKVVRIWLYHTKDALSRMKCSSISQSERPDRMQSHRVVDQTRVILCSSLQVRNKLCLSNIYTDSTAVSIKTQGECAEMKSLHHWNYLGVSENLQIQAAHGHTLSIIHFVCQFTEMTYIPQ